VEDAILNGLGVATGTAGMMVPSFFTAFMFITIGAHYMYKRVVDGEDETERKAEENVVRHMQKLDPVENSPR
jgi:hypothetical protein